VRLASAFGLALSFLFDFQKGRQYHRETLLASLASLRNRSESDLRCIQRIIGAIDQLKGGARE